MNPPKNDKAAVRGLTQLPGANPTKNNNLPEPEHQEVAEMVSMKDFYVHVVTDLSWLRHFEAFKMPADTRERLENRIETLVELKSYLWEKL